MRDVSRLNGNRDFGIAESRPIAAVNKKRH